MKLLSDDVTSWNSAPGRYYLNQFHYDALVAAYSERPTTSEAWTESERRDWVANSADRDLPGPYLTLAAALGSAGETASQRKALIKASSNAANPLEKCLLGWVRYGYRPWIVIFPMLALMLGTGWTFQRALDDHAIVQSTPTTPAISPNKCDPTKIACPDPVAYAIEAVVPVTIGQKAAWRPNEATSIGKDLARLVRADVIFSWLLAGVFLAAVAGWLKRT